MNLLDRVTVRPCGEHAVVLELGDRIDVALHDAVLAIDDAIADDPPAGVTEVVPTYRSLLLRLEPDGPPPDEVVAALRARPDPVGPARDGSTATARGGPVHDVVVSFAEEDAEDLEDVAAAVDRTVEEVVQRLVAEPLRLFCYGFVPGFAYLQAPAGVSRPRRETPRAPVAPGAVIVAAGQLALCPVSMPTGWWVVGRTGHTLFDPAATPPVPFAPGDRLRLIAA